VPCLCADRCHAWPAKDACMRVRESRWMLRGGNLCCHLCCESVWLGSAYYYLTGIGFRLLLFSFLVFFSDLESWAAWEEARPLKSSSTSCMACYQCPVLCHRLVTTGSPPFIEETNTKKRTFHMAPMRPCRGRRQSFTRNQIPAHSHI
jgi:hypothetical protein